MLSSNYLYLLNMIGDSLQSEHVQTQNLKNYKFELPDSLPCKHDSSQSEHLQSEHLQNLKNCKFELPEIERYHDSSPCEHVQNEHDSSPCEHLRIIGKAGIGKSTYINNTFNPFEYLRTAYTRISASQINGNTLSSIFKLGRTNENTVNKAVSNMRRFNKLMVENIQKIKGLVIDEFYIAPADIIDKVDLICQEIRECKESFGGLQLILVGDDRQSEAIDDSFVDSDLYKSLEFKEIILQKHDKMRLTYEYMDFCDKFRNPNLNRRKMVDLLNNKKFTKEEIKSNAYSVYYRNADCNKKNKDSIKNFEGDVIYTKSGVEYKKGMPIYITGSSDGVLCNGQMGILMDKKGRQLIIEVDNIKYELFPSKIEFKPGFAITIHLCQSKTWSNVNIFIRKSDLLENRKLFIRLIYVALTRVNNFENAYIEFI